MKRTPFNKSKSIVVDVEGYVAGQVSSGLGNQLFIIAATYAYSLKYNKISYFSETWPGISATRPSYWKTLLKNVTGVKNFGELTNYIDFKEKDFSYSPIPKYSGNIRLKGYYQSPKYFLDYEDKIKELFKLPEDLDTFAVEYMKKFEGKTTVMVHIRRGDYLKLSKTHHIQGISYYKNSKHIIEHKLGYRPVYIYFSDDKQWVRENLSLEYDDIIVEDVKNDYEEFAIMQQCNHFIIANSSFSWWAAWLGSKKEVSCIIAPLQWFGPLGPKNWMDIYPQNWITLKDFDNNFFEGIKADNRIHIINRYWIDDIIINEDMTFCRHLLSKETGKIFIGEENMVYLIWDKYPIEIINSDFIVYNKDNFETLHNKCKNKFFLGLITCEKYKDKRINQDLSNCYIPHKYFIGDKNTSNAYIKEDIVYLPCPDNYESLPLKVYNMIKWVSETYPDIEYIIKADDDVSFNFPEFIKVLEDVRSKSIDYAGFVVKIKDTKGTCHMGKAEDPVLSTTKLHIPATTFCAGPCYILSIKSIKILLENLLKNNTIYEDQSVGYCLEHIGNILPYKVNFKNVCKWL